VKRLLGACLLIGVNPTVGLVVLLDNLPPRLVGAPPGLSSASISAECTVRAVFGLDANPDPALDLSPGPLLLLVLEVRAPCRVVDEVANSTNGIAC
jgi:hypothetical protein